MMKQVTTASGSVYMIDENRQVFVRIKGEQGQALPTDSFWVEYQEIQVMEVGKGLEILWMDKENPKLRVSTPVTEITETAG